MEALKQKNIRMFTVKLAKRVIFFLLFVLIFDLFLFSAPALAAPPEEIDTENNIETEEILEITNSLPESDNLEVVSSAYYTVTAYNSEVGQCDDTPCITANNFNVCEHGIEDTVAANWLPFGTKIRIPDFYGDKVFYVRDRMNSRYSNRVDIWMVNKQDAKKFGIKVLKIEVLSEP